MDETKERAVRIPADLYDEAVKFALAEGARRGRQMPTAEAIRELIRRGLAAEKKDADR